MPSLFQVLVFCCLVMGSVSLAWFLVRANIFPLLQGPAEKQRKGVWLLCRINGKAGFISKVAFEKASAEEWEPYLTGQQEYDHAYLCAAIGRIISPRDVVVVEDHSREYYNLADRLMLEVGYFNVPWANITPMAQAYRMVFDEEWDGSFTRDESDWEDADGER